jgi:dTDP-4-dehydrorhamnose reductase
MKKLFIAGHNGMVGSAIVKAVENSVSLKNGYEVITRSRADLDLTDQRAVRKP